MALAPQYEDVALDHQAFLSSLRPRVLRGRVRQGQDDEENAYRFLRSARFLAGQPCEANASRQRRCCGKGPKSPCFDISRPRELCCYKESRATCE